MAALTDLIKQVEDKTLRERLLQEADRLSKQKKFGLVFEEHIPECAPLYGISIKRGSTVAKKVGSINDICRVTRIDSESALCLNVTTGVTETVALSELVSVAQFGEPIYPTLQHMDTVENAPDSDLWHTLIEADNYHALQLLEYLYPNQVDCIYIDPPYNTGARDWKYNNDYVDSSDAWRHSKWLSMMQKRLKIAKRILNTKTGVLIATIDEHEVHHLRTLLEETFPDFYIQMVTYVSNPTGATQGRFSRVEEYAIYCFAPDAYVPVGDDSMLGESETSKSVRWKSLLRSGTSARREDRKNMFYPVFIDAERKIVVGAGNALPFEQEPSFEPQDSFQVAWPIRTDGSYGRWSVGAETFRTLISKGYVALGKFDPKRNTWGITYISDQTQKMIADDRVLITGRNEETGVVSIEYADAHNQAIRTVWYRTLHNAGAYGTDLLSSIIGQSRAFSFPKSLYAEHDSINAIVRNNPNALIVDFFAGSGTTLHAVNLLNSEDGGQRRCIIVTNNEVSEAKSRELKEQGYNPGDNEWEKHGIAQSVTWPRTKYSINGKRDDGIALSGEYFTTLTQDVDSKRNYKKLNFVTEDMLASPAKKKQLVSLLGKDKLPQSLVKANSKFIVPEKHTVSILFEQGAADEWLEALDGQGHIREFYIVTQNNNFFNDMKEKIQEHLGDYRTKEKVKRSMSEGFATNCEYFKLGFLDKNDVAMGKQFQEILPLLWLKAGAVGKRPEINGSDVPNILILPQNKMAVLANECNFMEFEKELDEHPEIDIVFIVTDSERAYCEMISVLKVEYTYQLYRDYLDNFRINARR